MPICCQSCAGMCTTAGRYALGTSLDIDSLVPAFRSRRSEPMTSVATGIGVCCAVSLNMASVLIHQSRHRRPPNRPCKLGEIGRSRDHRDRLPGPGVGTQRVRPAERQAGSSERHRKGGTVRCGTRGGKFVLKPHLNHQVRLLGMPDGRPQPALRWGTLRRSRVPG